SPWRSVIIYKPQAAPVRQALTQTFDVTHPCSLCHPFNTGKNSEKKSELQSSTPKIDMICAPRAIRLVTPFRRFDYALDSFSFSDIGKSPLVPPPRFFLS